MLKSKNTANRPQPFRKKEKINGFTALRKNQDGIGNNNSEGIQSVLREHTLRG